MKKRISRILAGLLCLVLLVGFVPADLLGDLIPEADAAAITFKTSKDWGYQRSFNGLFIVRSSTDPSLVLTTAKDSYTGNDLLSFQKLGAVGDIRRQMFVFRTAHNHQGANGIDDAATIYFRPLYEVYRYEESGWQHGNLWVQSGVEAGLTPSLWPVKVNTDANGGIVRTRDGAPENSNQGDFSWRLNVYQYVSDYKGFIKAGIYENNMSRDNNASVRYITQTSQSGSGLALYYNDAINQSTMNTSFIFEPCSYDVDDDKNVNLHTSLGETSQYMRAMNGFVANSSEITYGINDVQPYYYGWTLTALNNGYHAITSVQHDRYLALSNNKILTLGNQAHNKEGLWSDPQEAEQWQFVPYYDTDKGFTYLIVNRATGYILMRSAASSYVIADSYYATNEQNNRWMVTYPTESYYTDRGYANQTGYAPLAFANSITSIKYPLNLKTGTGAAYSDYHTLKLNPSSTVTGHFVASDKALGNAAIESRFISTSGYLFDSRMVTSGTPSYWTTAVSYANSTIENTTNQYLATMEATKAPPFAFKPVGSSSYSATIRFQFKYTSGMFMRLFGGSYSFNAKIQSADLSATYYESWQASTAVDVDFSNLTAGTVYTLTISKSSNSDINSHFSIFTNVQPITVQNDTDEDGTKLFDVDTHAYLNGEHLALNAVAPVDSRLEYRVKVTNRAVYNMFPQNFQSIGNYDNDTYGRNNLGSFSFGATMTLQPSVTCDRNGEALTLDDLIFVVRNADGTVVHTQTGLNLDGMKQLFNYIPDGMGGTSYGLPTDWSLEVQGIYYQTTDRDHDFGRKLVNFAADVKFHTPTLDTTYQKISANTAVHFTNEPFFVQWTDQELTVSKELLMEMITAAGKHKYEIGLGLSAETINKVILCNYNGGAVTSEFVSTNDTTLKIHYTTPGVYQINLKVFYNDTFAMIPTQVFVYDVSDKTYVLDYGLPVTIDKGSYTDDSDLNQDLTIKELGGIFDVTITIQQITGTKPTSDGTYLTVTNDLTTAYGTIELDANQNIIYTPTAILNGADYIYVVFKVERSGENAKLNVKASDELLMYKTITILPGNVVYYEDTISSITYPDSYVLTGMGTLSGTGVSGEQDFPSTGLMGHDDGSYVGAKDVMLSGQSVQKVTVENQQVNISFSFYGTGFEFISRVNARDAATLLIQVTDPSGATKIYPVITRFDPKGNGAAEVYQVPVFRLNNGTYGKYDVVIKGLPNQTFDENGKVTSTTTSYIYVDGLRIYNPLNNDPMTSHYGVEQGAQFDNLRDLILGGQGFLAAYTDGVNGFTTGSNYYVATDDKWFSAAYGGINELGAIGANNEIYIRKDSGNHIVVLKVKETASGAGLLQIGLHDVHDGKFDGTGSTNTASTVSYNTSSGWVALASNTFSGTEQYYNIDLSKCPSDGEYKLVILRVDSGFVSFTNIKHKNVQFASIADAALEIYTTPGYYFNQAGDMCMTDEGGNEVVITPAANTINLDLVNNALTQDNA